MDFVSYQNNNNMLVHLGHSVDRITKNSMIGPLSNVGSIGVINNDKMEWINTEIKPKKRITKNKRSLKPGCEKFTEYLLEITDPYWVELFENASTGKFPRGCSLKQNRLIYRYRKKIYDVDITKSSHDIINFLSKHLRLKSDTDRICDTDNHKKHINKINIVYTDWSSIKVNIKRMLIFDYCDNKQISLNLSNEEKNTLQTIINMNLSLGIIANANIEFTNQYISNINNVIFDNTTRLFSVISNIHINLKKISNTTICTKLMNPSYIHSSNNKKVSFSSEWDKYLKKLTVKDTSHTSYKNNIRNNKSSPMFNIYNNINTPTISP